MRYRPILFLIPALLLAGAGCASSKPAAPVPTPADSPEPQARIAQPAGPLSLVPATTDATWTEYSSKSLGISFRSPTKGRFAPHWEVTVAPFDSKEIADGCWGTAEGQEKKRVLAGGREFCHTSETVREGDGATLLDRYVTRNAANYVVLNFSKAVYDLKDQKCAEQSGGAPYTVVRGGCAPLTETDYRAALDGIVGTFQAAGAR